MSTPDPARREGLKGESKSSRLRRTARKVGIIGSRIGRFTVRSLSWLFAQAYAKPMRALSILAIAALLSAVAASTLLRYIYPRPLVTVAPFETPNESSNKGEFSGRALTDLLVDELHDIAEGASSFKGSNFSSTQQYGQVPGMLHIPVETSFGIEFKGVSLDQFVKLWDYARYYQQHVSGALILNNADHRALLRLRMTSGDHERHWEVPILDTNTSTVQAGMHELARQFFVSTNPEVLGRYYLGRMFNCDTQDQGCNSREANAATDVFRQWVLREPSRPEPFFFLAYALSYSDLDAADTALQWCLDLHPGFDQAVGLRAVILSRKGLESDSLDASLHALSMYPRPNYYLNAAVSFAHLKKQEDALRYFGRAIAMDRKDAGAFTYEGISFEAENKTKDALSAYQKALQLVPDFYPAELRRLQLLLKQNRMDDLIREGKFALVLSPNNVQLWSELGTAFANNSQFEDAARCVKKAMSLPGVSGADMKQLQTELALIEKMQAVTAKRK